MTIPDVNASLILFVKMAASAAPVSRGLAPGVVLSVVPESSVA
jgi:hypothetical protein